MTPEDKIRVTKLSCLASACNLYAGSGDMEAVFTAAHEFFAAVVPPEALAEAQPETLQPKAAARQAVA